MQQQIPPLDRARLHFGVGPEDLSRTLVAALEKGADYADLFFEHTFRHSLSLEDGSVNRTQANIDYGMGVRALAGDQTGYAFIEQITPEEMLRAARTAARIAFIGSPRESEALGGAALENDLYAVASPWEELSIQGKAPWLQKLNERVFALDKRVVKVNASMSDSSSHIFFCNSQGQAYYDYRPMCSLSVVCVMQNEAGQIENSFASVSYRMGAEFLGEERIEKLAREVVEKTAILFEAVKPKGGEMPVVMGAGGSGILLHEAIGHAFEADFNRKGISIFTDLLGKKVCDAQINVVDDGCIPFNRGAVNIDDEGTPGQTTYIVREGVLNSYLHDRISAKHYGLAPTGNGRRESFRCMPIPRMRATYMEAGPATEEDIIRSVKKGIYAENFTNGQVQIGAGDFTFFVKNGYLIENGRLTRPIKDVNIIGNGPKALADITMVGNNYKLDNGTWTCGKDGQSCPVTCGMPSALVKKLTVGGES
ncbi:MAG: TldD/PmbA family protein [Tannerella sp.]|jgi:TldD protein|nr:TldD/PmbA family protein [Tannerella sp.]